jgi:hypothetical protein
VGGDRQGEGSVRTARGTFVHAGAELKADATELGDGGEIIVWADETAQIYGALSATGGLQGGNGGFAETSGKLWLDITRAPNLRALGNRPGDQGGTWLLDPNNISIVADPCDPSNPSCLDPGLSPEQLENPLFQFNAGPVLRPTVDDSEVQAGLIAGALEQGVSVTLLTQTIEAVQGDQNGDITVEAPIDPWAINASPGSRATLSLLAANDLIVNADIGVVADPGAAPDAASNLIVDIILTAGDVTQKQNPVGSGEVPNSYVGTLAINADIDSAGGVVRLDGINIDGASGTSITTRGGVFVATTFAGNNTLASDIDTTTAIRDDEGNEFLGGSVTLTSEAARVPNSVAPNPAPDAPPGPSKVLGGDIVLSGTVRTDGGNVNLITTGGNITAEGEIDTSLVEATTTPLRGGSLSMRATRTEFAPLSSVDTDPITAGGRIEIGGGASIVSDGGFVEMGLNTASSAAGANQIVINGRIDTSWEIDRTGGSVYLETGGEEASVTIADTSPGDGVATGISTQGGRIQSVGTGSFRLQNAVLDAKSHAGLDPDLALSDVGIFHAGDVDVWESTGAETRIVADKAIQITPGLQNGTGNLNFVDPIVDPSVEPLFTGAPELIAEEILLEVGDGHGGESTSGTINLGAAEFHDHAGATTSPLRFSLLQEADLLADPIAGHIGGGDLTALEQYTLAASDGILTIANPATVSDPGLELRLRAGSGVAVSGLFSADPDTLDLLEIEISEGFTLDAALAAAISDAALDLVVSAGASGVAEDPSLLVEGSLSAGDSIVLHAGNAGEGDLAFGVDPVDLTPLALTLDAPEITLWAGDGDESGEAQIRAETLGNLSFQSGAGGAVTAFTLRQDAVIDDATIPDAGRFVGGVAGIDYTLRSDGAPTGDDRISIGNNGAAGLHGARLSLHALGGIDLASITETLQVQTLDIGGLGSFTYTHALDDKIAFTDPASSQLVLRAGLSNPGQLAFESGMTIEADEIRLVAGDGVGGNTGESASFIDLFPVADAAPIFKSLSPGADLAFVFRQDASIVQTDLPSLAENFGNTLPGRLAIRSDDGGISLNEFAIESVPESVLEPVLEASQQLVLSARVVTLARSDGENLVIDDALKAGPGAMDLQIRSGGVVFRATGSEQDPVVLPGSKIRLTAFDHDPAAVPGLVPTAFDFDVAPAEAPPLIEIDQDGDLVADTLAATPNFINPATQLGSAGDAAMNLVFLSSQNGSIRITPESVVGADLTLALESLDSVESDTRGIEFDGALFELDSLIAINPFGWTVKRAENPGNAVDLELRSEKLLQLRAGLLDEGDLDFAGDVILDANTLLLSAGDDPLLPLYPSDPNAPATENRPVVKVRDATGAAAVTLRLHDLADNQAGLQIRQHGSLLDSAAAAAQSGGLGADESLIPLTSQIEVVDVSGVTTRLGQLQLDSVLGDIRINRFSDFSDALNILLGAGQGTGASNIVHLEQDDGLDLDLSQGFETFFIFAPEIQFKTTGGGLIKAENNDLILLGASAFDPQGTFVASSPKALLFEQGASFDESSGDCSQGCLPNPVTQLGPTGASLVQYTLRSTGGSILLDDSLYNKLTFSALTLGAFASGTGPDITVRASSASPDFDIILESLTVGEDSATPLAILLEAPDSTSDNSELAILTLGDQTYNGSLAIDGRVELAGKTIHVTSTIDAVDDSSNTGADELALGVRGQALLDGDIGTDPLANLELLRVNFDPTLLPSLGPIPTLGFGGDSADLFTVQADTVEILAAGDMLADFESVHTPRAPLASSIFKRSGDLKIVADRFSMGTGEKLSVGGNLWITARTGAGDGLAQIGDLSAIGSIGDPANPGIVVDADIIEIQRRAAGQYVDATGLVQPDGGVDYVANAIDFIGSIEFSGSGAQPVFGIPDPQSTPDWMLAYSTFQSRSDGQPLTGAELAIPPGYDSPADLHPTGGSRDDPSTMFIGSEHVPTPPSWVAAPWLPFNRASVEELGIDIEPMSQAEYMGQLRRAMLIDDAGHGLTLWDGYRLRISDARIEGTEAAQAVALLDELLGPRYGRAVRVREALQNALDQYLRTSGARRVVGFELRRFVKNRPSSLFAAYKALEDLDTLFALHRGLGLTPGEYRPIQAGWLEAIRPEGITTRELAEAIQPSRYVRGSDVLDIFGE